jgi:hypothetical protein
MSDIRHRLDAGNWTQPDALGADFQKRTSSHPILHVTTLLKADVHLRALTCGLCHNRELKKRSIW